ncbi:MAG: hypothetical protein HY657_04065 [Acidobacteria bacterium]|nr:hypothetical protein [Acidobacteriota bacterium]
MRALPVLLVVGGATACGGGVTEPEATAAAGPGTGAEPRLPGEPTAVALPTFRQVTDPAPMFDSAPSHDPEHTPAYYGYVTTEYFASGTANQQAYTARVVIRRPVDDADFSGLVLAESMHGSGAAHVFEYTSMYVMDSGHVAVEITTTSPDQFIEMNAERYADLRIADGQTNEILAQVGALVRSPEGPLAGLAVRRMVLGGTSMSAGTMASYLPAHMVYRTPDMQPIYDGFLPTSRGGDVMEVDVPVVQIPTMHEVEASLTAREDSDERGRQYRLYVFPGMGHIDSRDNVRLQPNPCVHELSRFPLQAYMSVGLHHLFRWVDEGVVPPRAERIPIEGEGEDGRAMVLDEHGNPVGGIRNPYVDLPTARYIPVNTAVEPLIANPSANIARRGQAGANQVCRLSAYQESFSASQLRELYGNSERYVSMVEERLNELERGGWSLPVYHDLIMADARSVQIGEHRQVR